jgi:hypothetical protein
MQSQDLFKKEKKKKKTASGGLTDACPGKI